MEITVYGWPLGYALEAVRNRIDAREAARSGRRLDGGADSSEWTHLPAQELVARCLGCDRNHTLPMAAAVPQGRWDGPRRCCPEARLRAKHQVRSPTHVRSRFRRVACADVPEDVSPVAVPQRRSTRQRLLQSPDSLSCCSHWVFSWLRWSVGGAMFVGRLGQVSVLDLAVSLLLILAGLSASMLAWRALLTDLGSPLPFAPPPGCCSWVSSRSTFRAAASGRSLRRLSWRATTVCLATGWLRGARDERGHTRCWAAGGTHDRPTDLHVARLCRCVAVDSLLLPIGIVLLTPRRS